MIRATDHPHHTDSASQLLRYSTPPRLAALERAQTLYEAWGGTRRTNIAVKQTQLRGASICTDIVYCKIGTVVRAARVSSSEVNSVLRRKRSLIHLLACWER